MHLLWANLHDGIKAVAKAFKIFVWKTSNQVQMEMDVFGFIQSAADREQAFSIGSAADFPNSVRIGRLYANFKLEQSAANCFEKFDHLIINQVSGQFKMEVGEPLSCSERYFQIAMEYSLEQLKVRSTNLT